MAKKYLVWLLALVLMLGCFAGCAGDNQPTDGPGASTTTTATDANGDPIVPTDPNTGDIVPTDPNTGDTVPTDPNTGDTVPTVSTTLPPAIATDAPKAGYAAVGYVDTSAKKAVVLLGDGNHGLVEYTGTAPKMGAVHSYKCDSKGKYTFTYLTGNTHLKSSSDQLSGSGCGIYVSPDGYMWTAASGGDKLNHYYLNDTPIFIRYSLVEWRLATAADIKTKNDSKYTVGSFFDAKQSSDYADKDSQRWYNVGAILLGNADGAKNIYAPDLTHFNNVKANVVLGTIPTTTTPTTKPSSSTQQPSGVTQTPCIITTKYPTDDVVIADAVATDTKYGADPTGKNDSTYAIQRAINAVYNAGGGTVWLPAGKYRITANILVQPFVTLRGDWQDPDKGTDYGTILLMDIPSSDAKTGTINISGSAGVIGLTTYYPNQSLSAVKPYPFTFYVDGFTPNSAGYMLQTIQNCTMINSYRGIGACVVEENPHEMMTIDNVKGTILSMGAEAYNQADVGTWKNLVFDNKYWANAGSGLSKANLSQLNTYTKANATGLKLGDLEWTQFSGLKMSNLKIGLHITHGKRIQFAGSLYDVTITGCGTAVQADNMDNRWGTLITKAVISGDRAIVNNSSGYFRIQASTITGSTSGSITNKNDWAPNNLMSTFNVRTAPKPVAKLTVVNADKSGKNDVSATVQNALNARANDGGGVVYLPAGKYRLDKTINVPAGVELRGASSVAQREQYGLSEGTVFLVYSPLTNAAMVNLSGDKAGIRGVRFFYPNNITTAANGGKPSASDYTIRGHAANVYIENVAITGAYNGVEFAACNNHFIKKLVGCAVNNMMTVGGNNGWIEGCLQNGNAFCRSGFPSSVVTTVVETDVWAKVFDPITRPNAEYIRVMSNANNQIILNSFAYGVKSLIVNYGPMAQAYNVGGDNIGSSTPLLDGRAGTLMVFNALRYNGKSYNCASGAKVHVFNRMTINQKDENMIGITG